MGTEAFQNILLIQLRRIGDVLMTTPSIRALRHAFPDAHITFLTEAPSDQVLKHNPFLNKVLVIRRKSPLSTYLKFLWELRKMNFDLVIDFFSNPRSAQISWFSGALRRIGFNFPGRGFFYTDRIALGGEKYAAEHKSLLLKELGIEVDSWALDFHISDSDRLYAEQLFQQMGLQSVDFVVSISPVSRQPYKVWPPDRYAQIADNLIERYDAKILFIYGPGEIIFVDQVRQYMKHTALPDYDIPSLSQTKAIFEKVQLHIGNDNGPCHFAISAGIPTVTVFGRPKAVNWNPPGQSRHCAVEYDPGCKNDCQFPHCEHLNCINGIQAETVKNAVFHSIDQFQLGKPYV
ncbi:MAG: glycosyltransferase family 9 protein [SAR324 cluster bacterium]|nr:glycosyltransferase family 9 protein [SAR324 cluster bacterium]